MTFAKIDLDLDEAELTSSLHPILVIFVSREKEESGKVVLTSFTSSSIN